MYGVGANTSGDRRQLRQGLPADVAILPRLRLMGNAAWERGQYDRFAPSFLTEHLDFLTYFELASEYAQPRHTSLRVGFAQTDQRYYVSTNADDRTQRWLTLRHEFR